MPANKEPHYFCSDLDLRADLRVGTLAEYEALFSNAPPHALTGEASVFYLYSKVAIGQIMARNVNAKIIIMLRNPIEATRSMHAFRWNNHLEDVGDFEQAWRLQEARLEGRHLPPDWPYPLLLQYGAQNSYAPQVRRLLTQVPRKQCLFLLFEEFFADPSHQLVNQTVGVRSLRLDRLLRQPPPALLALRHAAHAFGFHPARALKLFNRVAVERPPLREAFRAELEEYFSVDVAELEQLLGRRLWSSSLPAAAPSVMRELN